MDIETAKAIFKTFGNEVGPQSDLVDSHEYWYKGHYNITTIEFIEASEHLEVLSIREANQLLAQFCVKVGPGSDDDNLYWQYYPHKKA
ncbi:hypothetical protein [Aeromonas intestinalis]